MTKARQRRKKVLKWLGLCLFTGLLLLVAFYFSVRFEFWTQLPDEEQLAEIRQSEATEIYAEGGELLGKYFIFDRQPVTFEELPKHLTEALIATEDARFYEHNGVDRRSLARVIIKTILLRNESSGGGSTISQQLIKNLYPRERHGVFTMPVNKVREAICATRLEKVYSKEEIITLYLNTVPFGDNTFGVESASEKFFGKPVSDLTLEESAVIVGMLKASHGYNPRLFPERSLRRRNTVLEQMYKYGYLTDEERKITRNRPLKLDYKPYNHKDGIAPYFRAELRKQAGQWLKAYNEEHGTQYNLFTSGLKIYTTLDYGLQQLAEEAMVEHMSQLQFQFEKSYGRNAPWLKNEAAIESAIKRSRTYKRLKARGLEDKAIRDSLDRPSKVELFSWKGKEVTAGSSLDSLKHYLKFLNTGVLSVNPYSGAVKTWIGGIDFEHFQYDHVRQSKRQVGSTFKPFVYATALEQNIDPCKYYPAKPVTYADYNDWTPTNSGGVDNDKDYAIKAALSKSINTIAVKVLFETGLSPVIDLAKDMGITSDLPESPSLALGAAELSVFELAKAYTSFLNNGKPATPYFMSRIENNQGEVLAEFGPEIAENPVFTERTRQLMVEIMKGTVNEGTAIRLRSRYGLKNDIAGKTGTTQNNKDGWFVALTPRLVTVTWVGADDHRIGFRTTGMGQGANSALPIFALMTQKMNKDLQFDRYTQARFAPPSMAVMNEMGCAPEKDYGILKRAFTNNDKPKTVTFKSDSTAEAPKKKRGFFGRLFGKKDKKDKKKKRKKGN